MKRFSEMNVAELVEYHNRPVHVQTMAMNWNDELIQTDQEAPTKSVLRAQCEELMELGWKTFGGYFVRMPVAAGVEYSIWPRQKKD